MVMKYKDIRDKSGGLRVSVDREFATYLITTINGKWIMKNFIGEGKRMVYTFDESNMITRSVGGKSIGVKITIVAGDYIDINED